jgi:hypothetical protein
LKRKGLGSWCRRPVTISRENTLVLQDVPGLEKMSVVIEEFVRPYLDEVHSFQDLGALLMKGMSAWNAAIAPAGERRERLIQGFLTSVKQKYTTEELEAVRKQLHAMIQRKLTHYPRNLRCITGMSLSMKDTGPYLDVVSTLEPPPEFGAGFLPREA